MSTVATTAAGIDASTYTGEPDAQGIIFVASRVTQPLHLSSAAFVDWYENIHVQEVLDTGGVPGAVRYERTEHAGGFSAVDGRGLREYQWLTVYAFPSVNYRFTPRFKALDGQSAPKDDLLE